MHETKASRRTTPTEFRAMVDTLLLLLEEQHRHTRRLVDTVRERVEARFRRDLDRLEHALEVEREVLTDLILTDRERVASLTEIGLVLGHRSPSCLRVAELALYAEPVHRDALLETRDRLRDLADELDLLISTGGRLHRRRDGRVTVFSTLPLPPSTGSAVAGGLSRRSLRDDRDLLDDEVAALGLLESAETALDFESDFEEDDDVEFLDESDDDLSRWGSPSSDDFLTP